MNRYQKLASNTVILAVGTFGSKLLVFLLMPLYTTWLTTAEFGAAELITGLSNFLMPLACVGLSTGVFRFAADREADREAVFSTCIVLLGIALGGFLLFSPILLLIDYVSSYLWLVVLYVVFADLQAVCAQYLRAIDRTVLFAGQGILNTVLVVAFNVLFLFGFGMGVEGYVLSVVMGNAITLLFLLFRAHLWKVFSFSKVNARMMKKLLRFSLPLIPTTVCWLITDLSDRYMVTLFCGESANGLYSAAYKIPTVVTLVASIFLQAWQFSAVAENTDREQCKRFYSTVFGGFLSVVMIGASGLILLSRTLTALLLNEAYYEAWRYMPALLSAAALEAVVSFLASVYLVRKKSMHSFLTALLGALANVVLNFILIPMIGPLGAAIATLASYALVMIVRLVDAHRLIPFHLCWLRLCGSTALLLLQAAVMTWETPWRLLCSTVLTGLMIVMNAPALLKGVKRMLVSRRGK